MSTFILKIHSLYEYFMFLGSFVYRNKETINRNIIEIGYSITIIKEEYS